MGNNNSRTNFFVGLFVLAGIIALLFLALSAPQAITKCRLTLTTSAA